MIWSGAILLSTTLVMYMLFWQVLLMRVREQANFNIKRPMLLYATWIALGCAVGQSQFLADFSAFPPRIALMWIAIFSSAILFVRSETGRAVAMKTPLWLLVGFQCFRIFAEWALYNGYQEGIIPVQMTFEGLNFDIITGVAAVVLMPILRKNPHLTKVAWLFNIIGLGLLIAISTIAVLSFPTPLQHFTNEPSPTNVALMPYILLPWVLVHAAYTGHFLLTLRLLKQPH